MSDRARVVLATFNRGKRREFESLLALPELELLALADVPGATPPEEHGETLLDNARLKARAACAWTGLPAIADDTGLEVDALGGAPGVRSARYAGAAADDAANVARLLRVLAAVPAAARTARFRTVCVACTPDGRECTSEGVLEGVIVDAPRGTHGFGYDPVFAPHDAPPGTTLAELDEAAKNAISHRGRAARALAVPLARLLARG